jgi:[protein-PII] uridylyltransferase
MAAKSFLNSDELKLAEQILKAPSFAPDGNEKAPPVFPDFSLWLSAELEKNLKLHPLWLKSQPIALGSWARGELCPKSDLDLLFTGPENVVGEFIREMQKQGVKIRGRIPEDPSDWTKGVEAFDVLALLKAKPFTPEAASLLQDQQMRILDNKPLRAQLLKAVVKERESRSERYDSIANFLEPNIKYGPGGLRDLEQALIIRGLFASRFTGIEHAFDIFDYYRRFFILLRQKLHLQGAGDILAASEQKAIADWLGYNSNLEFMREIQKGLSRVSFYADWVIERAQATPLRLKKLASIEIHEPRDLFLALKKDPSVLMQARVRTESDQIFAKINSGKSGSAQVYKNLRSVFEELISPKASDRWTVAFFRSRLVDHMVPEFRRIVGHVQHDQYHRFSVDAHIQQVLRELARVFKKPKTLGLLAPLVGELKSSDWTTLAWSCLYHDLAKGRAGDHSQLGRELANQDLKRLGVPQKIVDDVVWIVSEHLILSKAAFKQNPHSPKTWQELSARGATSRRLLLLMVFTAVDIRGTNPDAWTGWKERLLFDLVQVLRSPQTNRFIGFLDAAGKLKLRSDFIQGLDPFLLSSLPQPSLLKDCAMLEKAAKGRAVAVRELAVPLVVQTRGKETWVRFHSAEDRPGLFLEFTGKLFQSGCAIRHASIQTDAEYGVYDWFQVRTRKTKKILTGLLSKAPAVLKVDVHFDRVDLVSADVDEWIFSFRGRDQSGALIRAAQVIFGAGLTIRWAKVHTWGRQIDDIFSVAPLANRKPEEVLEKMCALALKSELG